MILVPKQDLASGPMRQRAFVTVPAFTDQLDERFPFFGAERHKADETALDLHPIHAVTANPFEKRSNEDRTANCV